MVVALAAGADFIFFLVRVAESRKRTHVGVVAASIKEVQFNLVLFTQCIVPLKLSLGTLQKQEK